MLVTVGLLFFQDRLIDISSFQYFLLIRFTVDQLMNTSKRKYCQKVKTTVHISETLYWDLLLPRYTWFLWLQSWQLCLSLWGLCVHVRSCWFNSIGFCVPRIGHSEAWEIAQEVGSSLLVRFLNLAIVVWFSVLAILGCIGAIMLIVIDV